MSLAPGGSLWVQQGTSVRVEGPSLWLLPSGASMVNDGVIDLGAFTAFQEAPDAWITGSGTERAGHTFASPLAQENVAGLGLTFTTATAPGVLHVVRGHVPDTMADGRVGVLRWFDTNVGAGSLAGTLRFHYAPSILNGIDEASLLMHRYDALGTLWLPQPGVVDVIGRAVEATTADVTGRFTLFADSATVGLAALAVDRGLRVHPSPATDRVTLRHTAGLPLGQVRLVDASGRSIATHDARHRSHLVIDVTPLAPGRYLLVTDDGRSASFLRP